MNFKEYLWSTNFDELSLVALKFGMRLGFANFKAGLTSHGQLQAQKGNRTLFMRSINDVLMITCDAGIPALYERGRYSIGDRLCTELEFWSHVDELIGQPYVE